MFNPQKKKKKEKKKPSNVSRCYPFCMVSTLYGNLIRRPVWAAKRRASGGAAAVVR